MMVHPYSLKYHIVEIIESYDEFSFAILQIIIAYTYLIFHNDKEIKGR